MVRFLREMVYGVSASSDVKPSNIGRALQEEIPLKLPGRDEPLFLLVLTGFWKEPIMLLTNLAMRKNREVIWQVVAGYLSRWLVEETIRFIKQSYNLEDLRVLDYDRVKNMVVLVLAAAFFEAVRLGEDLKLAVLSHPVTRLAKRFFGVPDFHYYTLADGIANLLAWCAKGPLGPYPTRATAHPQQFLFALRP